MRYVLVMLVVAGCGGGGGSQESRTGPAPIAARPYSPSVTERAEPKPYADENGVMVVFNDHKWFCFTAGDTTIGLCASNAAECFQFARLMKSAPTCAPVDVATCTVTKFATHQGRGGKCFRTSLDCLKAADIFLDEEAGEFIYASCTTFRYRGY